MTASVTWRPVTEDDIEFMIELFLALNRQEHPDGDIDVQAISDGTRASTLEQAHGKLENSVTYVIERDQAPIGRLRVVRTDEYLEIAGLQIHPEQQNRGAGTAVVTAHVEEARSRAVPAVLEVDTDNPDARRLYVRLGFTDIGETETGQRMAAS